MNLCHLHSSPAPVCEDCRSFGMNAILIRQDIVAQIEGQPTEDLVQMFRLNRIENTVDMIWAEEIYSELTRRGFNSDGTRFLLGHA